MRDIAAAAAQGGTDGRYPRSPPNTVPRAFAADSAAGVRSLISSRLLGTTAADLYCQVPPVWTASLPSELFLLLER